MHRFVGISDAGRLFGLYTVFENGGAFELG
jgi:hypothetical protein